MAARRKEEGGAAKFRQEKREANKTNKVVTVQGSV